MTWRSWLALLIVLFALANGTTVHATRRLDSGDQIAQLDDDVVPCTIVLPPEAPVRVDTVVDMPEPVVPVVVERPILVIAPKTSPPRAQ